MGKVFKARSVFHSLACVALVACAGPSATDEGRAPPSGQDDDAIGETQGAIELAPLYPVADTTVRLASPFSSYGNTTTLGVTSASIVNLQKSLIRFDQAAIAAAVGTQALYSARLDLTVAGISVGWLGGRIEALPMNRAWPEGNGLLGRGPSWVCADDTNTTLLGNLVNNCSAANAWGMVPTDPRPLPFTTPATDRAPVFTGGASTISLDVTKDVVRFLNGAPNNGWILAGSGGVANGEWVNFGSRESTNRPRLILNVGADQCTGDPLKGVPGQCGCGVPDSDTNFDGVADCVDAVVNATADTTIRLAVPFGNDGTGTLLGVTSTSIASLERSLVRVDQAAIDAVRAGRRVDGAFLEVTVAGISVAFGSGLIDIHAMNRGWPEGNGLLGHGPSWVCADDTNTTLSGNLANNCATSDLWAMLPLAPGGVPYVAAPTASAQLTWPGTRSLRFDVTADVQRFVRNGDPNFGWLIKGRESLLSGQWVNFGSRESGAPPALLLELGPYCPDTGKPEPGQCGCGTPDTDSDGDTTADCVDRCPDDNLKTAPGLCGCGTPDTDSDGDKIPDCKDPCPADASTTVGGDCGCPSGGALPAGTACNGVCGSGVCNGAGVCGTPTSCVPAPSCGCVPYFTRDRIYWVCTCAKPGSDAASACGNTDEQTLVRIDDAAENAWVQARIGGDAWIGATDLPDEGTWHWPASGGGSEAVFWDGAASGAPHYGRYSNWADTEPSGGAGSNCAAILKSTGRWVDDSCGASRPFACERIHFKDTPIEPDPRPACERLNIPCGTGDWSQCQSEATVFEESTPAAQKASLSNCDLCTKNCTDEAQCAIDCDSACTGSAEPPTGNASCPDLDDPAEYALPAGANIYCAIQIPLGVECASSSTCGGFHCGRATRCSSCDPAGGVCVQCEGDSDCPGTDAEGRPFRCVGYLTCGVPVDECVIGDVPDGLCDEQAICEIEQGEYDPDPPPTADLEPTVFDPQEQLKPSQEPTTNTEQYPDEPPCDTGSPCALDRQHNWCHYEVTEDLNDRTPKNPRKVLKSGGSSPISFSVDPDLNLTFKMTPGPLGIAMPDLAGVAAFKATAEVNALGLKNRVLDLIDLSAQIHGGVNPDLCGVNTDGTRAIVFGIDLLPEDFEGVQEPSATDAAECRKALGHFQEAVDRAKKAFSDARELLEQYKAVDSGHNLQKLCEQYVKSPPLGFPAPTVPCADETPEQTINRFIDFYVKTTDDVRRIVRDEIAGKLDDWFALDATFAIGDGLKQVEEFTLLNQTFPVGPIPANLEVLLVVGYGLGVSGTATFQAGALLKDLVALTPGNDLTMGPPFVSVGTNGTPYVDAGISLFVGVGFDAGFASAKAGVSGSISLGHVSVPAHATAGITIGTSDDDRDLPPYMTEALVDPDVPLLPQKRYHYGLVYDIGAALQLRDVLSGEIGVKVKVKFFFFSKTWKKRIIKFNGLCPAGHPQSWCDVPIFDAEGGVAEGDWDWGTVQMPMPFLALRRIGAPKATGLPTVPFATSDVAELFYDSLCACIPTWETMTTAQKAEVNDCFRLEDCCDQGGSQTCFFDPDDSRKKCTDCRAQGESCSNDSECNCPALTAGGRPANNCLFRNTPDGVRGTCQRLGDCNGPCNDDTDCVPNQTCSEFSDGTTSCEPATSCIQ